MGSFMSLISASDLIAKQGQENLIVLEATWYLPKHERSGEKEYLESHIPEARFFDYDQKVCDKG